MGTKERRKREKARRREQIVNAAEAVFLRQGFDATTMTQIASSAEVSKGTVYLYFQTKDEVFLEVSRRLLSKLVASVPRAVTTEMTGALALCSIAKAYLRFAREHRDHFRAAMGWLTSRKTRKIERRIVREWGDEAGVILEAIRTALERGQEDGSVRAGLDPHRTARLLWASLAGGALVRLFGPRAELHESTKREDSAFVDLVLVGVTTEVLANSG